MVVDLLVISFCFVLMCRARQPLDLRYFRTRRSYDLKFSMSPNDENELCLSTASLVLITLYKLRYVQWNSLCCVCDRKGTCLNSSHVSISYAFFCLKMVSDP